MKRNLAIILMAALALFGCQNMELDEQFPVLKVFTATIEDNDLNTKTSLDEYGNVLWKAGDQVSIFVASTINQQYQVTDASDGQTSASLNPISSPGFVAGGEIPNNVAFYPYSSSNTIAKNATGYVVSTALPSVQNYADASFGNGAFPMAAVTTSTTDMNLKFKNVLGGLKLQLKGTASIASISVTGNNDEPLCGAAAVSLSTTSTPTINLTDASAKTVTLDCASGIQLNESTAASFVIALPPMTMTGGFTVVVTDTEGKEMEIKTTRSQTITRSSILKMPAVNYVGVEPAPITPAYEYVDLGLSVKWATFNVGATKPEEYGDYFAWGETEPKEFYSCYNYKYCNGSEKTLTKYCYDSSNGYNGFTDNKIVLDLEDDAAHVNWGGDWRMPTIEEMYELENDNNCIWTWTAINGVRGCRVESKLPGFEGNWIFLPAAGWYENSPAEEAGSMSFIWSSSIEDSFWPECGQGFIFGEEYIPCGTSSSRYIGYSVRPVSPAGITGISIKESSMPMQVGNVETLVATVSKNLEDANDQVEWSSSNVSVATVDNTGRVTAISAGTAIITAKTVVRGLTATCSVTVSPIPVYEYVDLGLSVKWATFNVGATKPEEYGDYFAWGETEPYYKAGYAQENPQAHWKAGKYEGYSWSDYKYCKGSFNKLTKYCLRSDYGYNGFIDNKNVLDIEDDAAHANWGGDWRMPTKAEQDELRENCTWTWTTINGISGNKVKSNVPGYTDKWIFLPAADYRSGYYLAYLDRYGEYWSSTISGWGDRGVILRHGSGYVDYMGRDRGCGCSVRPVCP